MESLFCTLGAETRNEMFGQIFILEFDVQTETLDCKGTKNICKMLAQFWLIDKPLWTVAVLSLRCGGQFSSCFLLISLRWFEESRFFLPGVCI